MFQNPQAKTIAAALLIIALIATSTISYYLGTKSSRTQATSGPTLRSDSYDYISPILFNDFANDQTSPELESFQAQLQDHIDGAIQAGSITQASLYYRHLPSGQQVVINNDTKYFPASLTKLPLAIAYHHLSLEDSDLLDQPGRIEFTIDHNQNQEITPANAPVSGQDYTTRQLLDMMLIDSDNISYNLLMSDATANAELRKLFNDLKIEYPYDQTNQPNVFTVKEFSRFYRILYNATHLNVSRSQHLMETLTKGAYTKALRAGVGEGIAVASKYGINTHRDLQTNAVIERQLHECGIVYTQDPYLLCLMTRGTAENLSTQEQTLADISKLVFEHSK